MRTKIVLMALAIAMLASITMGVATYQQSAELAEDLGAAKLAGDTRLVASELTEALRAMRADATILASTPPIQGIIRAARGDGIDPTDGSSTELWKTRLATIFTSMLVARPFYTQIRYLSIDDQGRELVRVNRTDDGYETVSEELLQSKAHRDYFKEGNTLGIGEWSYSDVTFNREYGGLEEGLIPNIRLLLPIFDSHDQRFGMIVINADYEELLASAIEDASPGSYTIATNAEGDYLVFDAKNGTSDFAFHLDEDYVLPAPMRPEAKIDDRGLIDTGEYVFYSHESVIDLSRKNLVLKVMTRTSKADLLAPADRANFTSLFLTLGLLLATSAVAFWLARRLTKPLEEMTAEVERLGEDQTEGMAQLHLPVKQPDEIGALARAFQEVTGDLLESEAKIRAIIDNVGDGFLVKDESGKIEIINPACEALFGYAPGSMPDDEIANLIPGGMRQYAGQLGVEVEAKRRDGSQFDAELSVSTVEVNGRILYCGIVRDISERKKIARMKDEFVSTVNHELRTPLTSIAGSLSLLQAKAVGKLDDKSARLIELATAGAERLSRLVNDILDVEKIEAGKLEYRLAPVDLIDLIQEIISQQEPLALRHDIAFVFQSDTTSAVVIADPDRFEQALVNLLSNAAKYSKPGQTVEIDVSRLSDPDRVCVSITDHGPGIPKGFEKDIFERFSQADQSGSQKQGSSGLGLYITKTLVEAFGGTIDFKTSEGEGTTFFIEMPLAEELAMEELKSA